MSIKSKVQVGSRAARSAGLGGLDRVWMYVVGDSTAHVVMVM